MSVAYSIVSAVMMILVYPSGILANTSIEHRLIALGIGILLMVLYGRLIYIILISMISWYFVTYNYWLNKLSYQHLDATSLSNSISICFSIVQPEVKVPFEYYASKLQMLLALFILYSGGNGSLVLY